MWVMFDEDLELEDAEMVPIEERILLDEVKSTKLRPAKGPIARHELRCKSCTDGDFHADYRHGVTRCERLPHMKKVRDFLREHLNETAERLNQASDGALEKALEGYVDEIKLKKLASQNRSFKEFWEKWKWLVMMQQWCPYVDEMEGAVDRQADESPRHAY